PLLCGMPSSLLDFTRLDQTVQLEPYARLPIAIFVSGESLFGDTRQQLEQWFGCKVYEGYTSSEGGLIALECRYGRGLHVQNWRVKLEVLDEKGNLSNEGAGELV